MKPHPPSCFACPLDKTGLGFVEAVGPRDAAVGLLGMAPGKTEAFKDIPFAGDAGSLLDRVLRDVGQPRSALRIANVTSCFPPGDWLEGAPWEAEAVRRCRQYLDPVLREPRKVWITLGGLAARALTGIEDGIKNLHGNIIRDPEDRFWVVPTFHPSHLRRGAMELYGVVRHDIRRGLEIAKSGWVPKPPSLVVDPSPAWFDSWVEAVLATESSPSPCWLAVDIETPGKLGKDEQELEYGTRESTIIRINFACSTDEGITVPCSGPYLAGIRRLLASSLVKVFWHELFDVPILGINNLPVAHPHWDAMWCLRGDTKIPLAGGGWQYIRDIVERRVPVTVLGMDDSGKRIETKVVGWHRQEVSGQKWIRVQTDGTRFPIVCTPDHKVWTSYGWCEASALEAGDVVRLPMIGSDDLIHGTLLGDGYYHESSRSLRILHGPKQRDYLYAKARHLGVEAKHRIARFGHGAAEAYQATVTCSRSWRALFYDESGRKRFVPPPTNRALAVWYMDDGNLSDNGSGAWRVKLATAGFVNPEDCLTWLREKFGGKVKLYRGDGGVTLSGDSKDAFLRAVSPHVHPSMEYKLPPALRGYYDGWLEEDVPQTAMVLRVGPAIQAPVGFKSADRYCLTVEDPSHRFFVLGGLVQNCWHILQPDLFTGLGFAASFVSPYAWKHLAKGVDPDDYDGQHRFGRYAAMDPVQTLRCAYSYVEDLTSFGLWPVFERFVYRLDKILRQAEEVGWLMSRDSLLTLKTKITEEKEALVAQISTMAPKEAAPLVGKWKKPPSAEKLAGLGLTPADVIEQRIRQTVWSCSDCGADDVPKNHSCGKKRQKKPKPKLELAG